MKIGDFEVEIHTKTTAYKTVLPEFAVTIKENDEVICTKSFTGRNKQAAIENMLRDAADTYSEDWILSDFKGDIVKKDSNTYSNPEGVDWFVRIKGTRWFRHFVGRPWARVTQT